LLAAEGIMAAKTITFSVQVGSGGFEVARAVAERRRFRYFDWEVTARAANEAGATPAALAAAERVPSFVERVLERFAHAGAYLGDAPGVLGEPTAASIGLAVQTMSSDQYRRFIERVVREIAEQGDAVIVGHAGQVVLRDNPTVLRVFVCGSTARRADRLAVEQSTTPEAALPTVEESDRDRIAFFKRVYHVDWLDAHLYDLTLNTDRLSLTAAADLTMSAADELAVE
jgi:cytidylate kinase